MHVALTASGSSHGRGQTYTRIRYEACESVSWEYESAASALCGGGGVSLKSRRTSADAQAPYAPA